MSDVPFSVTRALDDYIKLTEEPRLPDGMYHPSSFWTCLRQTIYGVRGVEKTNLPDAQSLRRFKLGHQIHALVQTAISYSPDVMTFYPEFGVTIPELNITGHGDGLIFLTNGDIVVLEVKSARASSFKYGKKDGHVQQASIYSLGARDFEVEVTDHETGEVQTVGPLGERVKGILLVYIEKEDANTAEYFIPYSTEWRTEIERRVAEADEYRNDPDSLPPRLPLVKGKKPWPCNPKWCEWYTRCQTVDDAEGVEPGAMKVEHW